jgi:hypothetical protein
MSEPLFLVGGQRSGTTALGHAVAAAVAERGGCFTVNGKLFHLTRRWLTADDLRARHVRADEIGHALDRKPAAGPSAEGWRERLDVALRTVAGSTAFRDPIEAVRWIAGEAYGSGIWGDKYNEYLLDLDYLLRLYPDARWLFVHRHPVEVTASMLAWTGDRPWRPADAASCERKWAEWNMRWLGFRDRVPAGRRLEANYDELCTPDGIAAAARFVGVEMAGGPLIRRSRPAAGGPVTAEAAQVWAELKGTATVDT